MRIHPEFKEEVLKLIKTWKTQGLPSGDALAATVDELRRWKDVNNIGGLWVEPPLMATATVDDGFGQGLAVIHKFAAAVGLSLHPIGLMQKPDVIIDACRSLRPAILGLTILQFDSQEAIAYIASHLPAQTKIVAGGPVFAADPEFAGRAGIHVVAANVGDFLDYLINRFRPMG